MEDTRIQDHIEELVAEEHRLLEVGGESGLNDAEHARLQRVGVELDQCWDLLRQRRARREAGQDPDLAEVRRADVVEGYQQ